MHHTAEWIEIEAGQAKFVHHWRADRPPKAVVTIVHGLGEHGGRYHPLAKDFVDAGLDVLAFDQQGHGHSAEIRGRIQSYASLLDDIRAFVTWAQHQHPQLPIVLFGHSMGGNLVINYMLRDHPHPQGAIASSPMIEQTKPPSRWLVSVAQVLGRIWPNMPMHSEVDPERLMSHPEEQQMLRDDELFHSQLSLRLAAGLVESGRWALEHAQELRGPLLLTHGTNDFITSPKASAEFARRAGEKCELEILEGMMHDPFRDVQRERVINKFLEFALQFAELRAVQ